MAKIYKLYHGTIADFNKVDLRNSLDKKDFGRGFYTTRDLDKARDWAVRRSRTNRQRNYYIYCLQVDIDTIRKYFNVHEFRTSMEWVDYILANRLERETRDNYDLVIGPIADAETQKEIEIYRSSIRGASVEEIKTAKERLIRKLKQQDLGIQYCFKTQRIVKYINNTTNCKWTRKEFKW